MYLAEFQTRSKRANEGWAAFADDLKVLANKAFPQLHADAKEQLALNHYLGQIIDHQIAFNVKQKRPRTLDEAVSATLELESYLLQSGLPSVSPVAERYPTQVVAGVRQPQDTTMQMLTKMMERLDRLELERATPPQRRYTYQRPRRQQAEATQQRANPISRKPVVCHKCKQEGHFAKGCAVRRFQPPGN